MNAELDEAVQAVGTRLRVKAQLEPAIAAVMDTVIDSGYHHRPARQRDLTPEQYRADLHPAAVAEVYGYTALQLSGNYRRAAAYLLHAFDRALRGTPQPARPQPPIRCPRGGVFHGPPGLADTMPGLDSEITAAAEHLNRLDYDQAEPAALAIAARLAAGGPIGKQYAIAIARHLIETEARRLEESPQPSSA
ncbi:hypothetical protein [Kitasatospora cheerisanensis]|uniref:Uncharacterized protein n=1 Tax=Kitasatospora cheerisanensis KCTC 2395 TaxID=1348663 RepID=A0A066Z0F3_9ACTN|nr:hypothetical protein [Kitasatospora cheerisanensis]KDN85694.1 hypothetical protein KCH_25220 [Kitasatospora cheerisanensis KCTC 2395]